MKNFIFKLDISETLCSASCAFFVLVLLFLSTMTAKAQSIECGVDISPALSQAWIAEAPNVQAAAQRRSSHPPQIKEVPVRFTVINGNATGYIVSSANINSGLNMLNQAFTPAGLHFFQCGELNEIWDSRIEQSEDIDIFINSFAYTSGAMEVYIKPSSTKSRTAIPCASYQTINPNYTLGCYTHENWMLIVNPGDLDETFVHETGHHLGLLHTFNPNWVYQVPVLPTQIDNPYPVLDPNGQIVPTWLGRELVIRATDNNKVFVNPNFEQSGDGLKDTPADCNTQSPGTGGVSPGCYVSAQSATTCDINASALAYRDYNNDPIYPLPAGSTGILGRNYMSYWQKTCVNQFTQGQLDRIAYFYDTYQSPSYAISQCGNFTDLVELEGSSTGLQNVILRVRHPDDARVCNVTTSPSGKYSGTFHSDQVQIWAYHNGKKSTLKNANDPLKMHYDHTPCEWRRGLSTFDLVLISKHILGVEPLNSGYKIIAADANKSNSVTTFDLIELRKLLLGIYDELPGQEQPWRYIPEFIPQDYATAFNVNPFNINGGSQIIGANYLEQGWQFSATNLPMNKRGWDAIKIGDVNNSWPTEAGCPNENEQVEDSGYKPALFIPAVALVQDQEVSLVFRANSFQNVEAFQLGIKLPADKFEVLGATTGTLPGYLTSESFGIGTLNADAVATLWFDPNGGAQTLSSSSEIFTLVVKAKQPIADISAVLKLDNSILANKFWQTGESSAGLTVTVETPKERSAVQNRTEACEQFTIYPNPFSDFVTGSFLYAGRDKEAQLSVSDLNGRRVMEQKVSLIKGHNDWEISIPQSMPSGVYKMTLSVSGQAWSTKLVKQ